MRLFSRLITPLLRNVLPESRCNRSSMLLISVLLMLVLVFVLPPCISLANGGRNNVPASVSTEPRYTIGTLRPTAAPLFAGSLLSCLTNNAPTFRSGLYPNAVRLLLSLLPLRTLLMLRMLPLSPLPKLAFLEPGKARPGALKLGFLKGGAPNGRLDFPIEKSIAWPRFFWR